jgi:hypothetical protein
VNRHGNLTRFRALATVVEEHERAAAATGKPLRERDRALYATLERLERSIPLRERR